MFKPLAEAIPMCYAQSPDIKLRVVKVEGIHFNTSSGREQTTFQPAGDGTLQATG